MLFLFLFGLHHALQDHGVCHLQEACDISAGNIVALHAVLTGSIVQIVEDPDHDALEHSVHFLESPAAALRVLAHLQRAGRHAAGVGRLARGKEHAVGHQVFRSVRGRGHVRALRHGDTAVRHKRLRVFQQQLVLRRTRQCHIALDREYAASLVIFAVRKGIYGNR